MEEKNNYQGSPNINITVSPQIIQNSIMATEEKVYERSEPVYYRPPIDEKKEADCSSLITCCLCCVLPMIGTIVPFAFVLYILIIIFLIILYCSTKNERIIIHIVVFVVMTIISILFHAIGFVSSYVTTLKI